jgi:hypothetical protein
MQPPALTAIQARLWAKSLTEDQRTGDLNLLRSIADDDGQGELTLGAQLMLLSALNRSCPRPYSKPAKGRFSRHCRASWKQIINQSKLSAAALDIPTISLIVMGAGLRSPREQSPLASRLSPVVGNHANRAKHRKAAS